MNINEPIYCAVDADGNVLLDFGGKLIIGTEGFVKDFGELVACHKDKPFYIAELRLHRPETPLPSAPPSGVERSPESP